jgi:hypothetical protein
MLSNVKKLVLLVGGISLLSGCAHSQIKQYSEQVFNKSTINIGRVGNLTLITGYFSGKKQSDILALYRNKSNKTLIKSIVLQTIKQTQAPKWQVSSSVEVQEDCVFFDTVTVNHKDQLICLSRNKSLLSIDIKTGTGAQLLVIDFDFNPADKTKIHQIDITRDLNGDGLEDIIFPSFDGFIIATQLSDGTFAPFKKLGPKEPFLNHKNREDNKDYQQMGFSEITVPWYVSRVHQFDYNLDGLQDLVFWNSDKFDVYIQRKDGFFSIVPIHFVTDIPFDFDAQYSTIFSYPDEGIAGLVFGLRSQSRITYLHSIQDLNGDNIADIVTHSLKGRGLTKQQSRYRFYFGKASLAQRTVEFSKSRGAQLKPSFIGNGMLAGGYSTDLFQDFNQDGVIDVMLRHVNMQVSKMFRLFFTKTIALDLDFYSIDNELQALSDTLSTSQEKSVSQKYIKHIRPGYEWFDGKDGIFFPVTLVGDINGDMRSDLLIGYSHNEMHVYYGVNGPQLFQAKPHRVSVNFSDNELLTTMLDINGDGKQDLLIQPSSSHPISELTMLFGR